MGKILLFLATAAGIFIGCASTTQGGVVGADRSQLLLFSAQEMDQSAARAYVQTLTAARNKGALNVDPVLTSRVKAVAKRLIEQVGVFRQDALKWKWQVNVISEDTINAWCMPGGRIVVYSGIINKLALNDAQLAAVMGHEMARAGYDPKEAVNVWLKMSKQSGGGIPEILSTHPSNESRIEDLRQIAQNVEPLYLKAK